MDGNWPLMVPVPVAPPLGIRRDSVEAGGHPLPAQHNLVSVSPRSVDVATLLVADPRPVTRISLSHALRDNEFSRVLEVGSAAQLDDVITGGIAGDLALLSIEFGAEVKRMIEDLGRAGWLRILVTVPTDNPAPVIQAVRAGASGFLRERPPGWQSRWIPVRDYHLSNRELMVIRLVAEGRSNKWIGQQLGSRCSR